jgi:nitroreductase
LIKKIGFIEFFKSLARLLVAKPTLPSSLAGHELLSIVLNRRSVRSFTDRDIADDVFNAILEAGRLAPSTVNLQTWTFFIFTPEKWSNIFSSSIPFKARRAVMIMGDSHRVRTVLNAFPHSPLVEYTMAVMNASLAAMNMNIAAEALGVSSVMLSETGRSGLLDVGYLREKLSLPENVYPLMTIVFGYAKGPYPPMPPKLPLAQICFEEKYREADHEVMEAWFSQMIAGYKAGHLFSSFESQLRVYESKLGRAEADLKAIR